MAIKDFVTMLTGKRLVGFDIGDRYVKIAVTVSGRIKKCVIVKTPDGLVSDGVILSMDAMADFLRETAKSHHIAHGNAAVVMPDPLVYTKIVDMPAMTESQLNYNLPFEFRDYLTDDKSNYIFDYAVRRIVTDVDGEPIGMNVMACAVLKRSIAEYRSMFRRAGFPMKCAYSAEYVGDMIIRRYAAEKCDNVKPEHCCLVDVGYKSTGLFFYHDGNYVVKHTVAIGISDFDDIVAEQLGVDCHVAHSYVLSDYNNVCGVGYAEEFYADLASEMLQTVNFYNHSYASGRLSDIYIYGGGYGITRLVDAVRDVLVGMNVHPISDVFCDDMKCDKPWLFANACGATLENSGETVISVKEAADE